MSHCENKSLTFEEKELAILRRAVDKAEERAAKKTAQSDQVREIIKIVEDFLRQKKLVCYGGTAINNILPAQDQFYDKSVEIPDYDFFSPDALDDAKELADIYARAGYDDVEAKAGVHHGTFKVYVNFIPVADITHLDKSLFKTVSRDSIRINGIAYAPANYLRMAMYLELSRPAGDVSRWEKVLKRLILLNKNYPLKNPRCHDITFMREFEGDPEEKHDIYSAVKNSLIDQGLIFFGGYASTLYGRYMPKKQRKQLNDVPDFDVLSEDPQTSATIIKERLTGEGFKDVQIYKKAGIGEIIAPHYEVVVNGETVCLIYEPLACHSYNTIRVGKNLVNVATIDTMLSFYLAFLYVDRPYYDHDRILCMAQYLFSVQAKNRLQQKGLLRRFSINCYGKQDTLEEIRANKANMFKKLKDKRNSKEYEEYFLRYVPKTTTKDKKEKKEKKKKGIKTKKSKEALRIKTRKRRSRHSSDFWGAPQTAREERKRYWE
jgi:hypothetical protein